MYNSYYSYSYRYDMPAGLPILISLVVIATLVLLLIPWCRIFR